MEITNIDDYLYFKKINLNLDEIKKSCQELQSYSIKNFGRQESNPNFGNRKLYSVKHNLFLFPYPQFHELYDEIKNLFYEVNGKTSEQYYIESWLNVYEFGQFNEWHRHWLPQTRSWHGIYCVDTEPSHTSYRLPHRNDIIDVQSENNKLIIGRNNDDIHRSSEWNFKDRDRLTIAFNIVPQNVLYKAKSITYYWVPI